MRRVWVALVIFLAACAGPQAQAPRDQATATSPGDTAPAAPTPTTAEEAPPAEKPSPEDATPTFPGIWPVATRAELDELQAAVDQGHQPWRLDPVMTASSYLDDVENGAVSRGTIAMGKFHPHDAQRGDVSYTLEGGTGLVHLRRLGGEGSVWFVTGKTETPAG